MNERSPSHPNPNPCTSPDNGGDNGAPNEVSVPVNLIPTGRGESGGAKMRLASLTPEFNGESHRVYYDLLTRAIDAEAVQNVALTGAYGTGKSSVLAELRRRRKKEIIELSLSTIAPDSRGINEKEETSSGDKTNLIQKEIVKQLLYRLPPYKTPRSRFHRTGGLDRRRWWIELGVAALAGTAIVAMALLLGVLQSVVESAIPEPAWRRIVAYALLASAVASAVWLVRRLIAGRPAMSASVGTGLTSVTLSNSDATYFDEYLDEIVYFFQASKARVVLIEDIDRFEDVQVFDTLRALNGLLNNSKSLPRIVFVYAIRDSVFEKIGSNEDNEPPAGTSTSAFHVASRTKFFDVIIPVVPFVTADNSRDLMSRVMASSDFKIDQSLIRTAAHHVVDMRLIHNIRNEFEVYRNRLIVPANRIYGIDDDLVFAMVLYKNTHLADFEEIRYQESTLDHLYQKWREFVRACLSIELARVAELRSTIERGEIAEIRARHLGELMLSHLATLRAGFQAVHSSRATVTIQGDISESSITQPETWKQIASGASIRLQFTNQPYSQTITMAFNAGQIASILGTDIDPVDWEEPDRSKIELDIADCEDRIQFLRHHTWEELCTRSDITLSSLKEPDADAATGAPSTINPVSRGSTTPLPPLAPTPVTFDRLVEQELLSPLAKDLVRHGFITSHFALYTSTYYGTHLGPEALEYVRRCIEPGIADTHYVLDTTAVQQLLIEQGAEKDDNAEIFEDASIFNISIMNHLLDARPGAANKVARQLARWDEQQSSFVHAYCVHGEYPERLLAAMTPWWKEVVIYAATLAPVAPEKRSIALDAVLRVLPNSDGYRIDDNVRTYLEATYRNLTAVTTPVDDKQSGIVLDIFATAGAQIESIACLSGLAREAVVARNLYWVTEENLCELAPDGSIALDVLKHHDERVYFHALSDLGAYLEAFSRSATTEHTIGDAQQFARIVTDAAKTNAADAVGSLIQGSHPACRVVCLTEVPVAAWPATIAGNRTEPTFSNIREYISEHGSVDHSLSTFLALHGKISWNEENAPLPARQEVSVAVLNAGDANLSEDERIGIVSHLEPGPLSANSIASESGNFAAKLIQEGLVADDEVTFSSGLMVDWRTREAAIAISENFVSFVSLDTLPVAQVPRLILSGIVPASAKDAVVALLESYLSAASTQEASQIARSLNSQGLPLDTKLIQVLIDKGVNSVETIPLIARDQGMDIETLRDLLRAVGETYARIADRGSRPVYVPDDLPHRMILENLKGAVVSSFAQDRKNDGMLRVNLHRPPG